MVSARKWGRRRQAGRCTLLIGHHSMRHLQLHITPDDLPCSTHSWKLGRYESTRSCCGTKASKRWRSVPFQASSSWTCTQDGAGESGR